MDQHRFLLVIPERGRKLIAQFDDTLSPPGAVFSRARCRARARVRHGVAAEADRSQQDQRAALNQAKTSIGRSRAFLTRGASAAIPTLYGLSRSSEAIPSLVPSCQNRRH